jgi:NADH-quinone oxidoreductase subunit N
MADPEKNETMKEILLLMKSELMITLIIFVLLLIKLGKGMKNATLLSLVQVLLLVSI